MSPVPSVALELGVDMSGVEVLVVFELRESDVSVKVLTPCWGPRFVAAVDEYASPVLLKRCSDTPGRVLLFISAWAVLCKGYASVGAAGNG